MPKCSSKAHPRASGKSNVEEGAPGPTAEMAKFWGSLPMERRRKLLSVDRKDLFTRIRQQFCSRCFGLFVLRYEEMKGATALDCPACQEFYAGLSVSDSGKISVEQAILDGEPFSLFAEGKAREREREMQFMTGDICGSGFQKRPGNNMCALHCSPVPIEALIDYFRELPEEHRTALLTLREEDFAAELDAHMKYQLKICRDCRCNVMRSYRDLKPSGRCQSGELSPLELCQDFNLRVAERLVTVSGSGFAEFLTLAEDVECYKDLDASGGGFDGAEQVRHAETPELAREALIDSALLIYKGQIEVAFREQTAGHNALLLFVGLALQLMEEQLFNAFKELGAKEAEAELLDLVAKEKERSQSGGKKKKSKKASKQQEREDPVVDAPVQQCKANAEATVGTLQSKPPSPKIPLAEAQPPPPPEIEAGGWEVQPTKRRGAQQSGKKAGSGPVGATPERSRRSSLETPRSRSPFARRGPPPPPPPPPPAEAPKHPPRPPAVPVHAYSMAGAFLPPPPPPPPRDSKRGSRHQAEPSSRAAFGPEQPSGTAGRQEWTPWSGRSTLVAAPAVAPGSKTANLSSQHPQGQPVAGSFSLFHFSPVARQDSPTGPEAPADGAAAAYQLFGTPQVAYPLPSLAPVLSL